MATPKKPAGKTTGGAAALPPVIPGEVGRLTAGVLRLSDEAQRLRLTLDDLANAAERAAQDVQAAARVAHLLLTTEDGGNDARIAADCILSELLPGLAFNLSNDIAREARQAAAQAVCPPSPRENAP